MKKWPVSKLPWDIEKIKDEEAKKAFEVLEKQYRLILSVLEEFESRIAALEP